MRVLLAGGGTGGHVIPAIAIARELQARYGAECLFLGTPRGLEGRLVPQAGFALKLVQVGALNKVGLGTRLKTLLDLPRAIFAARRLLKTFDPDVVIGVGGYASGPGMIAAVLRGIATLVYEPNVVPGMANRWIAQRVSAAAVHFPETAKYFRNAEVTGVPVRREFFNLPPRPAEPPTLLIFGGSQGAQAINKAVIGALPALASAVPELRIIHQTGARELDQVRAAYSNCSLQHEVSAFIDDMPAAFARADVIVCRSGASTVAEITAAGKPAIFIPFPMAADDHQLRNAEALARADAAILIEQKELTPERLANSITELMNDGARRQRISGNACAFAHPDALDRIAEMAYSLVQRGKSKSHRRDAEGAEKINFRNRG